MKKYILIGIPGCGKTTLGELAAEMLGIRFFDTDKIFTEKISLLNPTSIFRMVFNGQFINDQIKIMSKLSKLRCSAIISTGAEVGLIPETAKLMKKMGTVIHIQRNYENTLRDMEKDRKSNIVFSLNGKVIDQYKDMLTSYMNDIELYEETADLSFENNGTIEEGLAKLISLL
ncbi:MAG: AAA family ATPase [Treponema sp.]|nr:AAA family ATPase [Treponema sp.]